ncbi:MAG: HAMP domain-containing protein [Alphaproteobacteria bacterium]|nr:HAMP domain-containing protein [Alphaproteobacteria bacterium]
MRSHFKRLRNFFSIKRIMPRTLLWRSLLILIVPVLLIQVIATYMFFDRHWNRMTTRLAYAVSGEIAVIAALAEDAVSPLDMNLRLNALAYRMAESLDFNIEFTPGGSLPERIKAGPGKIWENSMTRQLRDEISAQVFKPFVVNAIPGEKSIAVHIQLPEGRLSVTFPQRRLFSSSGYIFLLWMIGTSFLLLLIAIQFMRNQIRPIRKLAVAAERFGKGRDTPSFKPEGALEVRQAANAFLEMRRRIQRQISQRTDMLAGVSHDLRTPLTRMRLQLEMLPDSADVRDLKQDVQDMEEMIHGYLDFVRGDGDEQFSAVDLETLFEKIAAGVKRQNVALTLDLEKGLRLMARPLALERALGNLVNNAGKYGRHVWIRAAQDGKRIRISIEDDGPGIPPEHYEDVFKPFMRVDSSRNAETGGVGLGLPIAMDIVHAHGGRIELGRSDHGGLRAMVWIPL